MKVVVLCGGISTERDVSISSGTLVCKALESLGYSAVLLDVYLGIDSNKLLEQDVFSLGVNGIDSVNCIEEKSPNIDELKKLRQNTNEFFGPNVIDVCKAADITFIALHGENGENGKVQAAFDLLGIKYTGTGYAGSLLAMDKDLTRQVLISNKVNMAEGFTLKGEDTLDAQDIFLPAVVKPASGGSSVGVSIVNTEKELKEAISNAKQYDNTIVVEKYIKGREFSIGILDGKALPIIEIVPKTGFYDYKNKYQVGGATEICPANLDENTTLYMQELAKKAYKALGINVYARIDFILSEDGTAYCLEANTLPGMTPTSLLPQEAKAVGITYENLCKRIIEVSLEKYN